LGRQPPSLDFWPKSCSSYCMILWSFWFKSSRIDVIKLLKTSNKKERRWKWKQCNYEKKKKNILIQRNPEDQDIVLNWIFRTKEIRSASLIKNISNKGNQVKNLSSTKNALYGFIRRFKIYLKSIVPNEKIYEQQKILSELRSGISKLSKIGSSSILHRIVNLNLWFIFAIYFASEISKVNINWKSDSGINSRGLLTPLQTMVSSVLFLWAIHFRLH
jgi:hypothetical protein